MPKIAIFGPGVAARRCPYHRCRHLHTRLRKVGPPCVRQGQGAGLPAIDVAHHAPGEYEVNHLISLEPGGSNDVKNLWPESYRTEPWNAHVKDKLEDRLHELVCAGHLNLTEAQRAIGTAWIAAYRRFAESQASD
jgi:hypothetical protein